MFTISKETIILLETVTLILVLVLTWNKNVISQESVLPAEVRSALEQNSQDLNSITVMWRRVRSTNLDLKEFFQTIHGVHDWGFFSDYNAAFMWQNSSFYSCTTGKFSLKSLPDEKKLPFAFDKNLELIDSFFESSYNGKEYMGGGGSQTTETVTPGLYIYPTAQAQREFSGSSVCASEYFYFCGYKFTYAGDEFQISQESLILFYANKGNLKKVQNESLDGLDTIRVELIGSINRDAKKTRYIVFWLLPDRNYAVKRYHVNTLDGKIVRSIDNSDFVKLPKKEIYLPKISTVKYFSYVTIADKTFDEPLFEEKYYLADVSSQPINEAQFDLRLKYKQPGTMIVDHGLVEKEGGIEYFVPANPADLDRVIEAALTGGTFVPTPLPSTGAIIVRWLLIIAGIAMILYACYTKFIKKTMSD